MIDYRRNLSRQMLNHLSDLEGHEEILRWKKNGGQKEESLVLIFMTSINMDIEEDLNTTL